MKVYISGKIGEEVISDATRQKFARAEQLLRSKGYEVFNPADERWQRTLRREYDHDQYIQSPWLAGKFPDFYSYCLLRDMMVISTHDAVYFLDDFSISSGAMAEYSYALATGKELLFQDAEDAMCFVQSNDFEDWRKVWIPEE